MIYLSLRVAVRAQVACPWWTGCYSCAEVCRLCLRG
jgi:hypothetical protein